MKLSEGEFDKLPDHLRRLFVKLPNPGRDEVLAAFPAQTSVTGKRSDRSRKATVDGTEWLSNNHKSVEHTDSGSAARFFYSAKADSEDRIGSGHPTVKPVDLMQWLCRMITPPGGLVLDPFAGSGSTGEAAFREGFRALLIEMEPEYQADIARRMALCGAGPVERRVAIVKAKAKRKGDKPDHGPLFGEAGKFDQAAE